MMSFPALNIFFLPFLKYIPKNSALFFLPASRLPGFLLVSSPLNRTQTRRVVRDTRIPAGLSAAQLQSPVARCHIPCTSVGVTGTQAPVTFGIITVTRWFPLSLHHLCIFGAGCRIKHLLGNFLLPSLCCSEDSLISTLALLTRPFSASTAAVFWMFRLSKQQVLSVSLAFSVAPPHGSWFSAQL